MESGRGGREWGSQKKGERLKNTHKSSRHQTRHLLTQDSIGVHWFLEEALRSPLLGWQAAQGQPLPDLNATVDNVTFAWNWVRGYKMVSLVKWLESGNEQWSERMEWAMWLWSLTVRGWLLDWDMYDLISTGTRRRTTVIHLCLG